MAPAVLSGAQSHFSVSVQCIAPYDTAFIVVVLKASTDGDDSTNIRREVRQIARTRGASILEVWEDFSFQVDLTGTHSVRVVAYLTVNPADSWQHRVVGERTAPIRVVLPTKATHMRTRPSTTSRLDSTLSPPVHGVTVDLLFQLDLGITSADRFESALRSTLASMGIFESEIASISILPGSAIARVVLVAPETANLLIAFSTRGIVVSIEGAITIG